MQAVKKDILFKHELTSPREFVFDDAVAQVFDDMIERSVPHYSEVQRATVEIARKFCRPNSRVYDLGCSTGTTLSLLGTLLVEGMLDPTVKLTGVDSSSSMLLTCSQKLSALKMREYVELIESDITTINLQEPSVLILNYTLQFIEPSKRRRFIHRCYEALLPGGVLIITEKVSHPDPSTEALLTELYYDFKRRNGYSELEISQKREALENVLVALTIEENIALIEEAGFPQVEMFLKWYNFASFVAVKK